MKTPKLVKYDSGKAHCPACNGTLAYDGSGSYTMPIGLGFLGTRFQIDSVQFKGWLGECMDCNQPVLAWTTKKHVTKYPRLATIA